MKYSKEENINKNNKSLEIFLSDFNNSHSSHNVSFKEDELSMPNYLFEAYIRKIIPVPAIGKSAISYWTSRGWNKNEALVKRVKKEYLRKSPMSIEFWIDKGMSQEDAFYKIKTFRKTNIEYWTSRGYSDEEAKQQYSKFQKESSLANTSETLVSIKQVKYWLNKGYSIEEAKEKISNSQRTFSYEKCVAKYGIIEGTKRFQDRQLKWQQTIKKNYIDQSNKDGSSIKVLKKKYGKNWIAVALNKYSLLPSTRNLVENITKFKNIKELIKEHSNIEKLINLTETVYPVARCKIIQDYFGISKKDIISEYIKFYEVIPSSFGIMSYYNNHICRSLKEKELAELLVSNSIDYVYEKLYGNSKLRCDFYIPKVNLYIEYTGMTKDKKHHKYSDFKLAYDKKEKFCIDNSINFFFSSNIKEILNKIQHEIKSDNRRA